MPMDERERARLRRLVKAHVAAENDHEIDRIMAAAAPHAIGQANGVVSTTLKQFVESTCISGYRRRR
jgi:hypothetical protein